MKAALFHEYGAPGVVRIEDVPDPVPGPGEVRIAVRAAAMNHLDLWVRRGLPIDIALPHIGGSDIAGVVDAVGPGAGQVPVGTRVVVDPSLDYDWYDGTAPGRNLPSRELRIIGEHTPGGFADYAVVPAANLVEVPPDVPFEAAAAASLVGVTAWHAVVVRGQVRPGERVLVTGASGGVSTMAVQIARHAGAVVYAVTSGADNVARVRELGAEVVYDRLEVDYGRALWKDTDRQGVDLIVDSVGAATWKANLRALRQGGRLVCYGATTGPVGETNLPLLFWKKASILGSTMGTPADYRRAMQLVFDGVIRAPIDEVLPLERAREAHERLEAGEVFGKLVLQP